MKQSVVALAFVALLGLVGCSDTGTKGGPGAEKAKDREKDSKVEQSKDKVRQPEETFSLSVPNLSTHVKQGESKEITISIKRGKNIDEDVSIKFDDIPKGVTLDPASPKIKHGDTDTKVMVKAADDAAVGDFTIKVVGHPSKGADATNQLKLTVDKK